jgi:hypothetical protein
MIDNREGQEAYSQNRYKPSVARLVERDRVRNANSGLESHVTSRIVTDV